MSTAFVIMQIGNEKLDEIYSEVIAQALKECDLQPIRVDKHNEGGMLQNEIGKFIREADIVIADLTNERPNCYLEVGYTLGLGKEMNLILTARDDHDIESPKHKPGGPKVHFDIRDYDILYWDDAQREAFKNELVARVRRRRSKLESRISSSEIWNEEWLAKNKKRAVQEADKAQALGWMEVQLALIPPKPFQLDLKQLVDTAFKAQLINEERPLGLCKDVGRFAPKAMLDGVVAIVGPSPTDTLPDVIDYLAINRSGDCYILSTFWEDKEHRQEKLLFVDGYIAKIAQTLVYAVRFYNALEIADTKTVSVKIEFSGLQDRKLSWANRHFSMPKKSLESNISKSRTVQLGLINIELVELVTDFAKYLLEVFEIYDIPGDSIETTVASFRARNRIPTPTNASSE